VWGEQNLKKFQSRCPNGSGKRAETIKSRGEEKKKKKNIGSEKPPDRTSRKLVGDRGKKGQGRRAKGGYLQKKRVD